jgi:hypothetical protein
LLCPERASWITDQITTVGGGASVMDILLALDL